GFLYDGYQYYYRKNAQGDILSVHCGTDLHAMYTYDAWGNCTISFDAAGIGALNPFRYRGYYLDRETGLYYLMTRYYDPEIGRFVNADDVSYLDPEALNGCNLYSYCMNNPVMYADPTGHFPILAFILGITALVGMALTVGGVASDNNTLTAIGLTMVAVPALISGGMAIAAGIGGATYLGIIGGVTTIAGVGTGLFASAEYQEAITGNNWMLDAGMSEELYNGLMLTTAAIATIGTISCGVLGSIGSMSSETAKMSSLRNHPGRWKIIKQKISNATGRKYKGGISKYINYINRWTGSHLGIHEIIRNGIFIHGPHIHPWI
ncbi:MAG: RHS repeat-associated core domain-containing protein, partial [Clostridia bacterium]|nr:RHS repeat-associated core domain-containing protein [Clostridia bacterium]